MWVMITGVKRVEDAFKVWELGADAVGLVVERGNVFESGFISPEQASSITNCLSLCSPSRDIKVQQGCLMQDFRGCVLVTHLVDVKEIIDLTMEIGVTIIQLVGQNTPEDIVYIKHRLHGIKVIKTLQVVDHSSINMVRKYMHIVDAIELDTIDTATCRIGGTGKTHDWTISKQIVQACNEFEVPVILAGGLHADNVEKAIQKVKPLGVDVSSGVKIQGQGIQYDKLEAFIRNAKDAKVLSRQLDQSLVLR